ncbi:MAG: rod shape-determining protein MreD [Candidatus Omnitrophota bacterium]|nr:rod shape-determining protein MreD [Candidatus Omnitrophota bacterium]
MMTLILGIFQLTFLEYFRIFGIKPDLLLVTVVIAGLFLEMRLAIIFGIFTGIFKDIFSLSPFGLNVLLFSLWGFLVAKISRKISIEDNIASVILVFVIALLQNIASGLALIYSGSFVPTGIFLRIILVGSLYTALTLPLILKITKIRI